MRYGVIAVAMVMTCFAQNPAQAVDDLDRESLRGLPGVQVVIENIDKDAQEDGLLEDTVRTAVELILRSSGIRILTQSERLQTPSKPWLYVYIDTFKNNGRYAYTIRVSVEQRVSLVARPDHIMSTTTWRLDQIGTSGSFNISKTINIVESAVKAFANDFLTVNPR